MRKTCKLLLTLLLVFCSCACQTTNQEKEFTKQSLEDLTNTHYFLDSAIEHIFLGNINSKGQATGYHYDEINDSPGHIVEGTESQKDENGIYRAKVEVNNILKSGNNGYSTFFPDECSPQEVIDMINEAYQNRQKIRGNTYRGSSGEVIIEMYLTDKDKIISAYPIL